MIKWTPELQPRVQADQRTWMEWIVRNLEKLSRWTASHLSNADPHPQYALEGYGGIYLSSPVVTIGALTTTPTLIGGAAYDSELAPNPVDVIQDTTNGTLTILSKGIWMFSAVVTGEITPNTANSSNTIEVAAYNVTDGVLGDQPVYFTVPRYGETFVNSLSVPFRVTDNEVNKQFGLAIWIRNASPAITVTQLTGCDLHVIRVAKE